MKPKIKQMFLFVSFVLLSITSYASFNTPEETISNFFTYMAQGDTNGLSSCFIGKNFSGTGEKQIVSYKIAGKKVYKNKDVQEYKLSSNNPSFFPKPGDVELTILNTINNFKTYYLFRKSANQWLILTMWTDEKHENPPTALPSTGDFILTMDNVNLRAKSNIKSKVLVKIKEGQKVKLIKRTDAALTVGDKKGFWAWIEFEKNGKKWKGYVFDAYLKEDK